MSQALAARDAGAVTDAAAVADGNVPFDAVNTNTALASPALTGDTPSAYRDDRPGGDGDGEGGAAGAWPADWRQRLAGKDKNELKALERFADPTAVWKKARSLERKLAERTAIAVRPPPGAFPEELAAWRAERGIPDRPEAYFDALKLPDGKVLGEADKPVVEGFAQAMHSANATPEQVSAAFNYYQEALRQQADKQAEDDVAFKVAARDVLREEWGAEFKPNLNATAVLFKEMPPEVKDGLLTARMPNGRMVGDSPDIVKWLAAMAKDLNPAATVVGAIGGKGLPQDRLQEIRALRRDRPEEYNQNRKALEAEEIDLLDAELKVQRRGRAA